MLSHLAWSELDNGQYLLSLAASPDSRSQLPTTDLQRVPETTQGPPTYDIRTVALRGGGETVFKGSVKLLSVTAIEETVKCIH